MELCENPCGEVGLLHACRQTDEAYLSVSCSFLANPRTNDNVRRKDGNKNYGGRKSGFSLVLI